MDVVELRSLFDVEYGNKFDENKMKFTENGEINFISRDSKNNGCMGTVAKYKDIEPYQDGLITVSLGGSFLLSSFLQPKKFYTAQNIAVLIPKQDMNINEKIFYCKCISMNRFKYSAFGREANKTLKYLKVPKNIPKWVAESNISIDSELKTPFKNQTLCIQDREMKSFIISDLFKIKKGKRLPKKDQTDGNIPYVSSSSSNNGIDNYIGNGFTDENCITFACYGSIGEVFYQSGKVWVSDNANIFYLRERPLNPFIAIFLITILRLEQFRFSYGMTGKKERLQSFRIKLPVTEQGNPDWQFMEDYVKSLPYSNNL